MNKLLKKLFIPALLLTTMTANANALEEVKAKGEFSFAMSGQFPPFSFINDNGELVGFDVDIGMEVAKRLGVKGKPVQTAWDGILAGLLADKYDAIIGSMTINEERAKSVDFSNPYYQSGAQLFVKTDSGITNIDEMNGKRVGVTLGETYETWLKENRPEIEVVSYKGLPLIIADLVNGRIQGFVSDRVAGTLTLKDKELPAGAVGELLYPEKIGVAIRKDRTDLLDAINKALADMMADGTYEKISINWVGVDIR